jgi:GT2 family glycosyltransferase
MVVFSLTRGNNSLAMKTKPFVSIIVLNYNGLRFLKRCFSSLQLINYPRSKYEVILVDNGSIDDSVEYVRSNFPWVRTVLLDQNFGFGGGNNKGIRFAKGDFIVFLNNDTEVTEEWLSELIQASVDHSVPICSSKTLFMGNHEMIEYGGGKFTINGRGYSIAFGKANDSETECSFTGYPCAASMLIRKDVFVDLYGFDEDYFACLDDTDLGWRAWLFGHSVLYCPTSVVYHEAGGTAGKGRLSPLKAFHGTKDPIITVLKNLELRNVFFGVGLALSYDLIEFSLLAKNSDLECMKKKIQAYSWLFKNLRRILQKRLIVQNRRVVSDKWLRDMHFLATSSEAFQEYKRLSKLSPQV